MVICKKSRQNDDAQMEIELPKQYESLTKKEKKLVREAYITLQKGKCYHCGEPLDGEPHKDIKIFPLNMSLFPPGFLNNTQHLHHDHKTGLTLGVVHAYCNGWLWQYKGE